MHILEWKCMNFDFDSLLQHSTLQRCHNEHSGVSNHSLLDCLLSLLFQAKIKKHHTPYYWHLWQEPTGDRWIPLTASNTGNVSIWWRHHTYPSPSPTHHVKPLCLFRFAWPARNIRQITWNVCLASMSVSFFRCILAKSTNIYSAQNMPYWLHIAIILRNVHFKTCPEVSAWQSI